MGIRLDSDWERAQFDYEVELKYQDEADKWEREMMLREANNLIDRADVRCKFCGSPSVVKNGTRRGTQYWLCKDCGRGFVANKALPKMKYPMDIIAKAVYDYYCGVSLNNIRQGIKH